MSAPVTRPLGDNFPSVTIETGQGSSTSTNVQTLINSPLPWVVLAAMMSFGALILSYVAFDIASNARMESRMQQYYLLELDGKVIRFVDLPEGGYQRFKEKREDGK